jgi:hypothetical protein
MPRTAITVTQDETGTGGLCLGATEPVSTLILVEQLAQSRDHQAWDALMAPALAPLNCEVMHSTRDEAPGLLASVEHHLEAHHAPDVCHVQQERSRAVWAPLATNERAADKALTAAREQRDQRPVRRASPQDQPAKRGPGRPPTAPMRLDHAHEALEAARREHKRLPQQRERVQQRLQAIGQASHFVDLECGVRRNSQRIAADSQAHLETIRPVAQDEQLSQSRLNRLEKAERVVPNMQATIACVSGYGRQQVAQFDVTPPASFAMHAKRIPSSYLDRVAHTRTVSDGEPLRKRATRLRTPLCEPGGALRALRPETQRDLQHQAKAFAEMCQRSRANVDGRNGYVSLRTHQLRGLDLPRKRTCLTTIHTFFLTRSAGTTAAERFFGQQPPSMVAAILDMVDLPPAPRSPQRRF